MTTTAPSYYHWCQDKPCTTNQTYGYSLKEYADAKAREPAKPKGPFDHTRPFSNAGFLPHISQGNGSGTLTSRRTDSIATRHHGLLYCPPSDLHKFNINNGYVVGPVSIQDKMAQARKGTLPAMMRPRGLCRSVSAPPTGAYRRHDGEATSASNDVYLWHTLTGTLVHVQNKAGNGKAVL